MRRAFSIAALWLAAMGACAAALAALELNGVSAALWPMNGVMLAVVLRVSPRSRDRLLAFSGVLLCMAIGGLLAGLTPVRALRFTINNGSEVAIAAALLWRTSLPLVGPRAFLRFVLGPVLAAPIVAAGVATFTTIASGRPHPPEWTLMWAMSDILGMLVIGPLALNLALPPKRPANRRLAALIATQVLVAGVSTLIFAEQRSYMLTVLYPILVVAALAEPELGGPLAVLNFAAVAFFASRSGHTLPTAYGHVAPMGSIAAMQIYLASLVLTVLPVTALVRKLELYAGELEQRRREAEELSTIKTKLLAHVSHEIRSPLSGVTSLAQLLSDGVMGDLTPKQREGLAQISQSGAEVEALARDLLDAATLQSGKASVHLVDVEVEDALESAVAAARFRGKEYGGSVVVVGSYSPGLKVAADRLRMRQILINLIVNGLKYGGRPPLVQVAAYATDAGRVRFEVSDNGQGVSPELRQTLFQSFDRLGAEKSDIEGAGLGLALSRELAALQGGTLGVEDGDLGGARFWLELPLWRETGEAVAA
jgi:signal transduction histidine kinase